MKVLLARAQLTPLTKRTKNKKLEKKISIHSKSLYRVENDLGKSKIKSNIVHVQ